MAQLTMIATFLNPWRVFLMSILVSAFALSSRGEDSKPVSYFNDVVPIFKRSCTGCHHPGKLKGDLDLTTYPAVQKGGKHGAVFTAGDPKKSHLVEEVTGEEPSMPKEGDPLSKEEIALI